ncbi:MAG: hypothetical protein ABI590_02525, partial [Ilumatobacteraceae bacterium]
MDDMGSVVSKSEVSSKLHRSFVLRRAMWFGIGALGFGTIAFAISLVYIFRQDSQQRLIPVIIAILYILVAFSAVTALRDIYEMQSQLELERQSLEQQIVTERRSRQDREWIDQHTNAVVAQMKETLLVDEVIDRMLEGIGRTLGADFVHFYSLAEFDSSRFLRQWSRTVPTQIDMSKIANHESLLIDLAKRLKMTSDVIVVNDSETI